jgi:uncharacterized membrane protein YkoI
MKPLFYSTMLAGALVLGAASPLHAQAPATPGTGQTGVTQTTPGQTGAGQTGGTTMGTPSPLGAQPGTTAQRPGTQPGAAAGAATQDIRMSESQIQSILSARGYSDIEGMERDGDNFKISEAKRYGETVKDLRVDARTGQVHDEARLTEDQAKELLRERQFSDVSDVERDGNTITATAKQNDQKYEVRIDAETGTLTQQRAAN